MKRTGNVIFRSLHQLWCDTPLKNNKFILFSNKFSSQAIVWVFRFHIVLDYLERWHLPTNRYWLQGEEEIFLDTATCAMAFRILRVNGYDISSGTLWFKRQPTRFWLFRKRLKSLFFFVDPFTWLSEDHFSSSLGGYMKDIGSVLELFRASQIIIHPDEFVLEKQNFWTSQFLIQELSNGSIHADRLNKYISQEVFPAIKPFSLIYCRFTV